MSFLGLANESSEAAGFSWLSFAPLRMTIGLVIVPCVESRAWSEYEKSSVWVVAGQKKV